MLWTTLDQDGNLTIQANEPMEAYALKQWEKNLPFKRSTLKVQTGHLFDIKEITDILKTDIEGYKAWRESRRMSILLDEKTTADLNSLSV